MTYTLLDLSSFRNAGTLPLLPSSANGEQVDRAVDRKRTNLPTIDMDERQWPELCFVIGRVDGD